MEFTDQTREPFGERLLTIEVESRLRYKTPTVLRLSRILQDRGYVRRSLRSLAELCLDEALTNAIVHGNGRDPKKKVHVCLFCDDERWGAIIEDEGKGFDPGDVPQADEGGLSQEAGRGILLMDGYLDELLYSDGGRRVMLIRHRDRKDEAPEPAEKAPPAAVSEGAGPDVEEAAPAEEEPAVLELEDATFGAVTKIIREGDLAVVEVLDRRLSDDNVLALRQEVEAVIADDKSLVIDMSHVEYISSVILATFAALSKLLRPKGGQMMVCCVHPIVRKVLDSVRLDLLLDLQPTREAALAKLRREADSA
ncbi:MAG: ATP-binding protein [Planctomycetota bacterium]|jgi:serine/threonine-protein kinase RsbW